MTADFTNLLESIVYTDTQIRIFMGQELPKWKEEIDASNEKTLVFRQSEFGNSVKDLLLLALVIKYAQISGVAVTVIPDEAETGAILMTR